MKQNPVALVSTLYDPEGRLTALAAPFIDGWVARFREVIIFTSPEGSGETGRLLAERGARVLEDREPQGATQLGRVRLRAITRAAEQGHPHLFLVDFDRLIHWEACYPEELRRVERAIPAHDLLVLGRTARAFDSHPEVQRETERLANVAFSASYGESLDVTGGARGLSAAVATALVRYSRCEGLGVDGEWPILCRRLGLRVGYLATEGLEYETADRHAEEIEALGYEGWLARRVNTPRNWEFRLQVAYQIAAAAHDANERPLER